MFKNYVDLFNECKKILSTYISTTFKCRLIWAINFNLQLIYSIYFKLLLSTNNFTSAVRSIAIVCVRKRVFESKSVSVVGAFN